MKNLWRTAQMSVHVPAFDRAEDTLKTLGRGGRALFLFFAALLIGSSVGLLYLLESRFLVDAPAHGGMLTEGVIGSPRFINPLLAISDADRDLTALVYSGLLRAGENGGYVPDLAQHYEISEDGRTYTFVLRNNVVFHDGTPVTAEDVVFTITMAQDSALKSPLRANWDGITAEVVDPQTVRFILRTPYAPFIENLTLGILPKSRWGEVSDEEFPFSELNAEPVGSGPYQVTAIERASSGIATAYTLKSFGRYALGEPYLDTLLLRFYQNEQALIDALASGDVDSASGISPANLTGIANDTIRTSPLNRVFGVFFNQNQSALLRDAAVRRALDSSLNRMALVEQVLDRYGTPLHDPIPPTLMATALPEVAPTTDLAAAARTSLIQAGWVLGEDGVLQKTTGTGNNKQTVRLEFDLATANVPELRAAAEYLRAAWGAMGARVNVQIFEAGDLAQNVIRPRKYEALLFGEVVGRELDLFAFWHSSQRNDPGLNIAGYTNTNADTALSSLRTTGDDTKRQELIRAFLTELNKDLPAVFLYAPDFVYSIPNEIAGVELGFIETPSDRFLSVYRWHRETDRVWPIFSTARN
jgi:peptide/nickel transport system substrate-binding protein